MKKNIWRFFLVVVMVFPIKVLASNYLLLGDCTYVLGNLNDKTSTAYLLQEIFQVFKFAAPVLVMVFTLIDFFKALVNQEKEDIAKAAKRLIKRLILAAVLFMSPTLINYLFQLLGWTGTCGIS